MSEAEIQKAIRVALGRETDLCLWRNAQAEGDLWNEQSGGSRYVRAGLGEGSADLVGILRTKAGMGLFFALEVKAPAGRVVPKQILWLSLVRRMGGFAAVVRSVDEARAALARARAGATE